jgi:P27 family predicted phage terminase small subunit
MPKHLGSVAAEKWRELVRLLAKRGTLTRVDSSALEIFCETYARWRGLCDEIHEHGAMVDVTVLDNCGEPHTKRVQNPAAKLAVQLENSMRAMLKEFSATPASREKSKPAALEQPKEKAASPEAQEEQFFSSLLKRQPPTV